MNTFDTLIAKYLPDSIHITRVDQVVIADISSSEVVELCKHLYLEHGLPLKTITATDERKEGIGFRISYVFGIPGESMFIVLRITVDDGESYPSITPVIHEASGYERKIRSFFGINPEGHPGQAQMILHENWPEDVYPLRKDFNWKTRPAEAKGQAYEFQKIEGEGIYEIPVGPVHAGIIEPGHFRFNVAGEEIMLLEARLGYKHKGVEKLFEQRTPEEGIRLAERISGDTSFTHALAYALAVERLARIEVSERASYLRVIFSELERLANHLNDIGFIMLDTGFSFGGSQCARLRERVMQLNERLSGSRFLRGLIAFGGVSRDIASGDREFLFNELKMLKGDFSDIVEIAHESTSVLNRLERTGKIDRRIAADHGATGIAGRAVGINHDARKEYPYAAYDKLSFNVALEEEGDVNARWHVRIKEVYESISIIQQAMESMPKTGKLKTDITASLPTGGMSIGIAEGWRGDIVYTLFTDTEGRFLRVDVRDPSFLNWNIVGHSGKGNIVPDFPLINKSYNLSYSGYDV